MAYTHLILGSNSADKKEKLADAIALLEKEVGIITKTSAIYTTAPWGYESPNTYLNQALLINTDLAPVDLLHKTQAIELQLGRDTKSIDGLYSDRPIDIDILFYENEIIDLPELCIPHPHIADRRFVLVPLCDLDHEFCHPEGGENMAELLNKCPDQLSVERL